MVVDFDKSAAAGALVCASCGVGLASPICCDDCGTLHAAESASCFALLGLRPRQDIDVELMRQAYLRLAQRVHPDRHTRGGIETAALSLRLTAQLNRAYRVLLDPVQRAEHLLELVGGQSAAEDKAVPQAVLMRTLEAREEIDDAKAAGDTAALARHRTAIQGEYDATLMQISAVAGRLPGDKATRRELRQVLNTVKYYERMLAELADE